MSDITQLCVAFKNVEKIHLEVFSLVGLGKCCLMKSHIRQGEMRSLLERSVVPQGSQLTVAKQRSHKADDERENRLLGCHSRVGRKREM